jgi:hypothetical protein
MALERFEEQGKSSPWGRSSAYYYFGEADILVEDYDAARANLRESIRLADAACSIMLLMRHLVGVVRLWGKTDQPERAVELATLIADHRASWYYTKEQARRLLDDLAGALTPEAFAAAEARGRSLAVEKIVADFVGRRH